MDGFLVFELARFFKSLTNVSIVTCRSDYDDEVDDRADISATIGLNIGIQLYRILLERSKHNTGMWVINIISAKMQVNHEALTCGRFNLHLHIIDY